MIGYNLIKIYLNTNLYNNQFTTLYNNGTFEVLNAKKSLKPALIKTTSVKIYTYFIVSSLLQNNDSAQAFYRSRCVVPAAADRWRIYASAEVMSGHSNAGLTGQGEALMDTQQEQASEAPSFFSKELLTLASQSIQPP